MQLQKVRIAYLCLVCLREDEARDAETYDHKAQHSTEYAEELLPRARAPGEENGSAWYPR